MAISNARIVGHHIDGGASVVHLLHPDAAGSTVATDTQDTAILNAIDLFSTTYGGTLVFPRGASLKINNVALDVPGITFDARHTQFTKSTATVGHMFYCLDGTADNFKMLGGSIDMNATSFSSGATVSAFHMVRCYNLTWEGTSMSSGIEEGLKLYNCKNLNLIDCDFDDFANNGVQVAVQSSSSDGFTGSTTLKPLEDWDGVRLTRTRFLNMDDGTIGEGQGISLGVASGSKTIKNIQYTDVYAKNCYRAFHTENNLSSQQMQNMHAHGVIIEDPIRLGFSFVGVDRGTLDNFTIIQSSSAAAASTDGDTQLVVVSGSSNTPSRDITIGVGTLQGASSSITDYGIVVNQTCGFTYRGTGHISGVGTHVGSESWATVWDFAGHPKNPVCIVAQSSAQVAAANTWTRVLWGSDLFDPNSMNSSSTATSERVTPPTPGLYDVKVTDSWGGSTSWGERGLRIYRDDGVTATVYGEFITAAATSDMSLQCVATVPLQQGASQYIRVERIQSSTLSATPSTAVRVQVAVRWVGGTT